MSLVPVTDSELAELLALTKDIPVTEDDRKLQRLDFAYGNLAASTRHRPQRAAFASVADEMGISGDVFEAWAKGKSFFRAPK